MLYLVSIASLFFPQTPICEGEPTEYIKLSENPNFGREN